MTLRVLPDVEAIVKDYLESVSEVTDRAPGGVLFSIPPTPRNWPLLVIQRIGGLDMEHPAWLDHARLQVDSYSNSSRKGGGKNAACQLALVAQWALLEMRGMFTGGVVSGVRMARALQWLAPSWPTASSGPAAREDIRGNHPRYSFDVYVSIHPFPGGAFS